jgi:hypothetical protein
VHLKSKFSNESISVEYSGFPYLGIWAKPGGKFVCIEPWLGISDSCDTNQNFETKEGILRLEANSTFKASYKIFTNDTYLLENPFVVMNKSSLLYLFFEKISLNEFPTSFSF